MNQLALPLLSMNTPRYNAQQIVLNFYWVDKKEEEEVKGEEEEEEKDNQRKALCALSIFYIDVHIYLVNVEQYKK